MKRLTSLLLALLMTAGLAVPALAGEPEPVTEPAVQAEEPVGAEEPAAAEGMDADLAALTLQVKQTLQIDDGYTDFTSDYYDGAAPYWSLSWADEARSLSVDVRPDGTVLSADFWENSAEQDRFYGFDPAFPPLDQEEARDQAQSWIDRLFTGAETARVDDVRTVLGTEGHYIFSGMVLKNGLPSPISFGLSINGTGMNSFYRSDGYSGYVGELPGPEPAAAEEDAAAALAEAVELELRWVSDGEGGAELRYVPVGPEAVVDAQSGEAVDMDALYASLDGDMGMYRNMAAGAVTEEAMAADGVALTEAELDSIGNYGDVMDQDELDASLQGIEALGLADFTVQRCSYTMAGPDGDVTAALRYTGTMTEEQLYGFDAGRFEELVNAGSDMTIYKYITVDAKTGALRSVSTSYPVSQRDEAVSMTQAVRVRAAENFLSLAAPELAAKAELCTLKGCNEGDTVTFAQVHEGYFYPDNSLSVTVNQAAGTVDGFRYSWEDVAFGAAEDVTAAKEAKDAYVAALEPVLGYVAWPVDITAEEDGPYAAYRDMGYTYVEELRLGYYYEGVNAVSGVDAVTGEAIVTEQTGGAFVYDDLDGVAEAARIEALGQAGVGFAGGSFLPEEEITMREAVTLLLQADGETVLPDEPDGDLLERALWRGFVTEEDWDPERVMTRMGFIRMVLGASRYGDGARLLDLGENEGWNVVALALGMDTSDPDGTLTRAGAAALLYAFMDR